MQMDLHPAQIEVEIPKKEKEPRYKSYAKILAITINLGLSNFYFGYSLVYISTVEFKEIMKIFSITIGADTAKGILTGCIPIGAGIGALIGTKLIHVFSRRKFVLLINAVAIVVGSLLYINNFILLLILRIIQGICVGLYTSIIPLYTTEISPMEIQSSTAPFTQIFCSSGTTIAYLFYFILNAAIPNQQDLIWYLILAFPLIPLVVQTVVLLFVFPYETPKYHLLHHQKKKTKALLAELYKPEYVETVYHEKIEDIEYSKSKEAAQQLARQPSGIPVPTIRLASKASMSSGAMSGIEMEEPATPPIAIFTAIHCMILRQFSGINAVVAYGGDIISQANKSLRAVVPCFLNFEIMLGAIIAIWILHKFGKRTLLQAGTVILAVSLLLITIGFFMLNAVHDVAFILILIGLIIFTFVFGVTYGAIIWSYVSEIVEPSYTIIATMVTWIFASIVIILFPILKTYVFGGSPSILFLFFCAWMTVSFFVNQKVLVETRNKTQHEIKEEFLQIECNPCPCVKKREIPTRSMSMTQSQLFDINSINLKLAELKRQKEHEKELKLLKESEERMLKSYNEMDIVVRKQQEKETKNTVTSSSEKNKKEQAEMEKEEVERPQELQREKKPSKSTENVSPEINETTFDQLNNKSRKDNNNDE